MTWLSIPHLSDAQPIFAIFEFATGDQCFDKGVPDHPLIGLQIIDSHFLARVDLGTLLDQISLE